MTEWLRSDRIDEFIGALELAADSAARAQSDPQQWRWVVLGLHLALQASLVCALESENTDGGAVLDPAIFAKWRRWQEDRSGMTEPPKTRMASLEALLKNASSSDFLSAPHTLALTAEQHRDIIRLKLLRDEYVHLSVSSLSIEIDLIRQAGRAAVQTIDWLAVSKTVFQRWYEGEKFEKAKALVNRLSRILAADAVVA